MAKKRLPIDPADEPQPDDYVVARLALWAGDANEAETRLSEYRGGAVTRGWSHLLNKSAVRTRRQLKRRQTEYTAIYAAASIKFKPTAEHVLRSEGRHLGAVLWVENEREYELRVYLLALEWEGEFYRIARSIVETDDSMATKPGPVRGYGQTSVDDGIKQASPESFSLGLEWAIQGTMFLQVAVSDFGTATVRGTWTNPTLPSQLDDVIAPFQKLIDKIDPSPSEPS